MNEAQPIVVKEDELLQQIREAAMEGGISNEH